MTSAQVKNKPLAQVTQVTSDLSCVQTDLRGRKRKLLGTCFDATSPLSLEREGGGGCKDATPPPSLARLQNKTPSLAAYAGAISRFCDLHGLTPDATAGDKVALEFDAFNRYLADLTAERRRLAELNF